MHVWLYTYIKHVYTLLQYCCKCVALEHKPFRDSICHKSCMIGQFSLCLTYLPVLHQPYTEAQLIFFYLFNQNKLACWLCCPILAEVQYWSRWGNNNDNSNVMSPMKDHKIN